MSIRARPNLNGNTRDDFISAYAKLNEAMDQLDSALAFIRGNVTHGRNYQTVENHLAAKASDDLLMDRAHRAAAELKTLRSFLMIACMDE
jgi:uncharacterized protein YukE